MCEDEILSLIKNSLPVVTDSSTIIAFSGIKAPRAMPREVVLIWTLGISGGLNSEIDLGFLEVTFTRSENSLIKDVISSDNSANSKNLFCLGSKFQAY